MDLISKLINFIIIISKKYNIDESHGLQHSLNIIQYTHKIYSNELIKNKELENYKHIIYISSLMHDLCDKKYMNEEEGIKNIQKFLNCLLTNVQVDIISKIISTMSYSKVKIYGYPDLGQYQLCYHIVREADLLCAYDFDRCMIYTLHTKNIDFRKAFEEANELFNKRVLKHFDDDLFITDYSKEVGIELHLIAINRINHWSEIINHF